jgi:hypothetical protein
MQRLGPDFRPAYAEIHRLVQTDYRAIKGCWRDQERYFQSRRLTEGSDPVPYQSSHKHDANGDDLAQSSSQEARDKRRSSA